MPPNKGATGRKTDAIHFVNARPSSESEKVYIQRLVRAHVGKWISDQTKDRSDPSDSSLCENHEKAVISPGHPVELDAEEALFPSSPPSLGSPHSPESNTSNSTSVIRFSSRSTWESQQTSSVTHPCPIHSGNSGLFKLDSSYTESQFVASSMNDSPSPPPPGESIETFGASMLDPFLTYPSQYAPDLVHARENYCLTILWPGLTPDSEDGSVMASSSWFPLSLSEPTLFTAFLFGSLSHQRVQWLNRWIPEGSFRARDQQLLELCQFETIKMINREVRNPNRAVCDAVILSVVCLAHSIADDSDEQRLRKTPFNAPLRRLQWLDVYGSLPPNLIHVQGLVQMVRLRGGLENIKLPGLAPILSFSDLVTGSTYLLPPTFSYIPLGGHRKNMSLQTLLGYHPEDAERHLGHLRQIGWTQELANVIYSMRVYMNIVDDLQRSSGKPDYALLADQRNLVHYSLMSLPTASQLEGFSSYEDPDIIYEACRLAGFIYSVGVVFPMPAQSSPLAQLASLLKGVIEMSNLRTTWAHHHAQVVLLWVLTLGGIAAEQRPERQWFTTMLGKTAQYCHLTGWAELRAMLRLVVWYDPACDQPGQNLWLDVERLFASL